MMEMSHSELFQPRIQSADKRDAGVLGRTFLLIVKVMDLTQPSFHRRYRPDEQRNVKSRWKVKNTALFIVE